MKDYDKNKESSNLKHCDINNLYGWANIACKWSQQVEDLSEVNENFIKSYNE